MPLSSMLSKVGKEISNYKMDSEGNIVKKKKDTYADASYGGGGGYGGYSNTHGSNPYGYGNGHSNGGYSNGGPHYEQPGNYTYAPPQGPPPGQYSGHPSYGPPGGPAPVHTNLPFRPKMEMWSEIASDGNTYFMLGDRHGSTAFSAKMPTMTGRLVVSAGGRKHTSDVLGEATDAGMSKSSAIVTLPNGFRCDLKKNGLKQFGQTSYTFTVPTEGGKQETFKWKLDDQGIKDMMKGAPTGWSLIREKDEVKVNRKDPESAKRAAAVQPLAKFIDEDGMGLSSKMKMGWVEFVGEGATGNLGSTWAAVALIAIVKAKAKQAEKTIIEEVTGAI